MESEVVNYPMETFSFEEPYPSDSIQFSTQSMPSYTSSEEVASFTVSLSIHEFE